MAAPRRGDGPVAVELGRPRFNGRDSSIHGVHRFQIRVDKDAASALALKLYFENGIMSTPPLFQGKNTIRLRVRDAASLGGPVTVRYRYDTADGVREHVQTLTRAAFRNNNEAAYTAEAPGLIRCRSVGISY